MKEETQMKYCMNCGNELLDNAKFCPECGTPVGKADNVNKTDSVSNDNHGKCPLCGSVAKSFQVICPYCGYEFKNELPSAVVKFSEQLTVLEAERKGENTSANGEKYSGLKFKTVDKAEKDILALIRNFNVPNTIEDVFEFMILASSNIIIPNKSTNKNEKNRILERNEAWMVKVEQTYQKGKISFEKEKEFDRIVELYETAKLKAERAKEGTVNAAKLFTEKLAVLENAKNGQVKPEQASEMFGRPLPKNPKEIENQILNLIRNYDIPDTKEDYLDFMIIVTSSINYDVIEGNAQAAGKDGMAVATSRNNAWVSKMEQIYNKAKLTYEGTTEFEHIQKLYDDATAKIDKGKVKSAKELKIGLMIPLIMMFSSGLLLVFMYVFGTFFDSDSEKKEAESEIPSEYYLYVTMQSEDNILFNTYDVEVYLDDDEVGTIANGAEFTKLILLEEGSHTLSVKKVGNDKVTANKSLEINENTSFNCNIKHKKNKIEIVDIETTNNVPLRVIRAEEQKEAELLAEEKKESERIAKEEEAAKQTKEVQAGENKSEAVESEAESEKTELKEPESDEKIKTSESELSQKENLSEEVKTEEPVSEISEKKDTYLSSKTGKDLFDAVLSDLKPDNTDAYGSGDWYDYSATIGTVSFEVHSKGEDGEVLGVEVMDFTSGTYDKAFYLKVIDCVFEGDDRVKIKEWVTKNIGTETNIKTKDANIFLKVDKKGDPILHILNDDLAAEE